ncbi:MAG: carboxypeptidase regulatory-like domain-containing protein [Gammaproteobacteria bacterium]|nr:carboxypeptidase regulatory-like domain-containing protein [Gammaproteobacteria bacterium]
MKLYPTVSRFAVALFFFIYFISLNVSAAPSFEERDISQVGWSASLVDVVYDPVSDTTTFTYQMTAQSWEKDLSHWVLAVNLDDVVLVSVSPDNLISYGLDPTTGVVGIKWDAGQDKGTTALYSITVAGQVGVADIDYSVKGGTYYAIGTTQGPGDTIISADTYSIDGSVYVDANFSSYLDADEPLLANVTVELVDAAGNVVATAFTDANGSYHFNGLLAGDYNVVIQDNTFIDDFNEVLASYMSACVGKTVSVTVQNANISDVNFCFHLNTGDILNDLNTEDPDGDGFSLPGEGRTIGFWKHQLSVAIKGKGRAQIDAISLKNHIFAIESYHLVEPFQFTDGLEYVEAFDVLSNRSSIAVDLLKKQLLATEFNQMAGYGLTNNYAILQPVLLAWGEYLVANEFSFTRDQLLIAKDIFDQINNMGH